MASGRRIYELIRTSISHRPKRVRRERAETLVDEGLDWSAVQEAAARHGVLPLFLHNLNGLLGGYLPESLRDQIRDRRRRAQVRAAFLSGELGRVSQLFRDESLPVLALKGPTLAQRAYGDVAMRNYIDLDIFVPREQFSEADRLLQSIGYEHSSDKQKLTGWRKKLALYIFGQWQFRRKKGALDIDLHTRVMPPGYTLTADFRPFWERSRSLQLQKDATVKAFAPEDMVLILAHHGIKNQWRALKYVADLGGLIRGVPDLDWSVLIRRARRMDSAGVLKLGLRVTQDLLSTPYPEDIQTWIGKPEDAISESIRKHLRNQSQDTTLPLGRRLQLHLRTKDTVMSGVRYGLYSIARHIWSTALKP